MRRYAKWAVNGLIMLVVWPVAVTCFIGNELTGADSVFTGWTHVFAMLPGAPGIFLRRAFYRWTLLSCADDVVIEFGAILNKRNAVLERGAYIGAYALIGWAWIKENSLIGSRVSILSGGRQHEMSPSGEWTNADPSQLTRVVVGRNTWVGEGAILMAGVGSGCMVGAGSVVSRAVPDGVLVAGNPARFIRHVMDSPQRRAEPVAMQAAGGARRSTISHDAYESHDTDKTPAETPTQFSRAFRVFRS